MVQITWWSPIAALTPEWDSVQVASLPDEWWFLGMDWQTFSAKGQEVNILGGVSRRVSVATT